VDRKRRWFGFWMVVVMVAVAAVLTVPPFPKPAPDAAVFRVGVLPSDGEVELHERYAPLLDYLSRETGWKFQLVVTDSYENLLNRFETREVDLANFGGFTFIQAHALYGASPLVMRDVDSRATSYVVVKVGGPLQDCYNLKCPGLAGARVLFGPELSTSGHLMPRHFLKTEKGIEPEAAFREVRYSTGHRATAYHVRDGDADIGMVYAATLRAMLHNGELKPGELQVIWETPPFPDNVWAVQGDMDEGTMTKLRDAFMALDIANEDQARIALLQRADSFIPAAVADFTPLMNGAEALGLMTPKHP